MCKSEISALSRSCYNLTNFMSFALNIGMMIHIKINKLFTLLNLADVIIARININAFFS